MLKFSVMAKLKDTGGEPSSRQMGLPNSGRMVGSEILCCEDCLHELLI